MNRLTIPLLATLAALSLNAQAQEVGRVISSTPIIQQVAVPRQICSQQQVAVPAQKSGAGAAMGAIAGGAIGNTIGKGEGNALATAIGMFGGAILGNKIEGNPTPEIRNVQSCTTQNFYENRAVSYHVLYEYAGKQYTVQMPHDPGPTVRLQITPVISNIPPLPAIPMPAPNMVPPPGSAPTNM
ncbi:MAG: glycine zipper 2TM domain-containing protein [Betaproteobacteria bacterium]|nr:glycine zipper 2TM domain-containing protein [Betaproteobacteria bacterium]